MALTRDNEIEIIARLMNGEQMAAIAKDYKVTRQYIYQIKTENITKEQQRIIKENKSKLIKPKIVKPKKIDKTKDTIVSVFADRNLTIYNARNMIEQLDKKSSGMALNEINDIIEQNKAVLASLVGDLSEDAMKLRKEIFTMSVKVLEMRKVYGDLVRENEIDNDNENAVTKVNLEIMED